MPQSKDSTYLQNAENNCHMIKRLLGITWFVVGVFGGHNDINSTISITIKKTYQHYHCTNWFVEWGFGGQNDINIIIIKMAIYCPEGSGTLRQQLLIMH